MRPSCGLPPHNHTFNVLLLGYYATGKSAILSRFSRQSFEEDYRMTLSNKQLRQLHPKVFGCFRSKVTFQPV